MATQIRNIHPFSRMPFVFSKSIPKGCAGFFKAYAMLPQIGCSLLSIPLKLYTHTNLSNNFTITVIIPNTLGDAGIVRDRDRNAARA